MNVQDFSFNPFALKTAQNAWQDEKTSTLTKVITTAGAAVYDIYAKNPYDLTFGNCHALINSKESQSIKTKVAVSATVAFGSLYTLMLYGTTVHLQGRCMLAFGSNFLKAGEAVQRLGTNIFVAGALPIYSLFYALPKQIVGSLPQVLNAINAKISIIAHWTFENMLQPFWAHVIIPSAQVVSKALDVAAKKIGAVLQVIWDKVTLYTQMVFEKVLVPFWTNTLFPALHQLGNVIHKVKTSLDPFVDALAEKITHAAKWTLQNVITPAWHQIVLPTLKTVHRTFHFTAKLASEMVNEFAQVTAKTASFLFQKVLIPTFKEISQFTQVVGKFLNQHLIKPLIPLLAKVAERVGQVFNAIFIGIIVPVVKVVANSASLLKNSVVEFNNEIVRTIHSIWSRIAWA